MIKLNNPINLDYSVNNNGVMEVETIYEKHEFADDVCDGFPGLHTKTTMGGYDFEFVVKVDPQFSNTSGDVDFDTFTNKGKVSKSKKSRIDALNYIAEKCFTIAHADQQAEEERIRQSIKNVDKDQERANHLADVINHSRSWEDSLTDGKWRVIKMKESHSDWYDGWNGEGHMRSMYYTLVPDELGDTALELNHLRRKHQNDDRFFNLTEDHFNFYDCDYKKREIRVADHFNDASDSDDDFSEEEFNKLIDDGVIVCDEKELV